MWDELVKNCGMEILWACWFGFGGGYIQVCKHDSYAIFLVLLTNICRFYKALIYYILCDACSWSFDIIANVIKTLLRDYTKYTAAKAECYLLVKHQPSKLSTFFSHLRSVPIYFFLSHRVTLDEIHRHVSSIRSPAHSRTVELVVDEWDKRECQNPCQITKYKN